MANSGATFEKRIQLNSLKDDEYQSIIHLFMVLDNRLIIKQCSFGAKNRLRFTLCTWLFLNLMQTCKEKLINTGKFAT